VKRTPDTPTATLIVNREFAEQAAAIPVMNRSGNENRDERDTQRHHRETNLLCAFERSFQGASPCFNIADDVFNHHDGVIDDKAGREWSSAINERLSRLNPARYMMPNVPDERERKRHHS